MKKTLVWILVSLFAMTFTSANATSFYPEGNMASAGFRFESSSESSLKTFYQRKKSVRVKSYTTKKGKQVRTHTRRSPKRH